MKTLTKAFLFTLICACATGPSLNAWSWHRRGHRRRSYLIPTFTTGLMLASMSASRAGSINSLRNDLNRVIDTINTQNKNIQYLNDEIKDLKEKVNKL
ncbi:hypothetical protein KAT92_00155 [Candidatus Babeliales bacterium]|nr:hypothetical protein [Candidatus Babeliales bacterium]